MLGCLRGITSKTVPLVCHLLLKATLRQHQEMTGTSFVVRDSKPLYVRYICVHNRQAIHRKKKPLGHHNSNTCCPATIKINIGAQTREVKISLLVLDHNHVTFPNQPQIYSGNRRLTPSQLNIVWDLMDVFRSNIEVRQYIKRKFGKSLRSYDVRLLRKKWRHLSAQKAESETIANVEGESNHSNADQISGIGVSPSCKVTKPTDVNELMSDMTQVVLQLKEARYNNAVSKLQGLFEEFKGSLNDQNDKLDYTATCGGLSTLSIVQAVVPATNSLSAATFTKSILPTSPTSSEWQPIAPATIPVLPAPAKSRKRKSPLVPRQTLSPLTNQHGTVPTYSVLLSAPTISNGLNGTPPSIAVFQSEQSTSANLQTADPSTIVLPSTIFASNEQNATSANVILLSVPPSSNNSQVLPLASWSTLESMTVFPEIAPKPRVKQRRK